MVIALSFKMEIIININTRKLRISVFLTSIKELVNKLLSGHDSDYI